MTTTQSETPERGSQAVSADAELLRLEAELLRLIEEVNADDYPGADDDAGDEAIGRIAEMELAIAQRPAHTPAGVAVKVRRLRVSYEGGKADWDRPLFNTALDALARLSGPFVPPAGDDAEVLKAYEEWKCLQGIAEKTETDAAWQATFAAEHRFLETPAHTLANVLLKLRVGCEPWNYEVVYPDRGDQPSGPPAVLATLRDLERMAGGPT